MKQHYRQKFYQLAYLSFLLAILYSCRSDEFSNEYDLQKNNIFVNKLTEQQFQSEAPLVFKKIQSIQMKIIDNSEVSRSIEINEEYVIETDEVLEVILGDVKTYTFAISGGAQTNILRNLVLKIDGQNNINGTVLEYDITDEEKRNLEDGIPINLLHKISWKSIENLEDLADLLLRSDLDCLEFKITGGAICPSGEHNLKQMQNQKCTYVNNGTFTPSPETIVQIIIDLDCLNNNGGGTEPVDGGGLPIGGDGWYGPAWFPLQAGFSGSEGSTDPGGFIDDGNPNEGDYPYNSDEPSQDISDNTFYTQPLLTSEDKKSPCNQLEKLSNSPNYTHTINHLREKASGLKEYGWVSKYFDGTRNFAPPTVVGQDTKNPNSVDLSSYKGPEWIGVFHNHTKNTGAIKMFSPADIEWFFTKARLKKKYQAQNNLPLDASDLFLGLVNENEVYCLKIKDLDKFMALTAPNMNKIKENLNEKFEKSGSSAAQTTFQKDLLQELQQFDLGIGLYEQDANGNWSEITLNPTNPNGTPIKTPCN